MGEPLSTKLEKTIGMAAGIYFQPGNPLNLLVVPNIKTQTAINKLLNEHGHPNFPDKMALIKWARMHWEREGIRPPKADKLGLPGGEIWDFEVLQYPMTPTPSLTINPNYAEIAAGREIAEETGLAAKKMRRIGKGPLFQPDRDDRTGGYENHFFLVLEVEGILNTKGYPGETGPPIFKTVTELHPGNFYPKHAVPLIMAVTELVQEGRVEYAPALEYLKKVFEGRLPDLREKPNFRPTPPALPENLTDDERFAAAMRQLGVKK